MTHRPNDVDRHTSLFLVDDDDQSHYKGDWPQLDNSAAADLRASLHRYRPRHLSTSRSLSLPVRLPASSSTLPASQQTTQRRSSCSGATTGSNSRRQRRQRRQRSNHKEKPEEQRPPLPNKGRRKNLFFSRTSTSTSLSTGRRKQPPKKSDKNSRQNLKRTVSSPPPLDYSHRKAHKFLQLRRDKRTIMNNPGGQQQQGGTANDNNDGRAGIEETARGTIQFIGRGGGTRTFTATDPESAPQGEGAPASATTTTTGGGGGGTNARPSTIRRVATTSSNRPNKGQQRRGLSPVPSAVGGSKRSPSATRGNIRRSNTLDTGSLMPPSLFSGIPSRISTTTSSTATTTYAAAAAQAAASDLFINPGTGQQQQQQQQHHLHVQNLKDMIPGTKANTSNLLSDDDDDSDLSDPDDNDNGVHSDSDLLRTGTISPASFQRGTVSFGSTSTMHHQAAAAAAGGVSSSAAAPGVDHGGGLLGDLSNPDDSFRYSEHRDRISSMLPPMIGSYSQYLNEPGGDANATDNDSLIPSATELARVVSVNLFDSNRRLHVPPMDSSSNYNQQGGNDNNNNYHNRSFLRRLFGNSSRRRPSYESSPSSFSSKTMWKNNRHQQVPDQSINLMDMENAVQQQHLQQHNGRNKKKKKKPHRPSLLNQVFDASFSNNGSDDDLADLQPLYQQIEKRKKKKRKSFVVDHPQQQEDQYALSVSCCSAFFILFAALAAALVMILSLFYAARNHESYYGNYNQKSSPVTTALPPHSPSAGSTGEATTLVPTSSPPSTLQTIITPEPTAVQTMSAPTPSSVPVTAQSAALSNGITSKTKMAAASVVPANKKAVKAQPAVDKVAPFSPAATTPPHDLLSSMDPIERERWYGMVNLISTRNLTHKDTFSDTNSSPYKALEWIMREYYNSDEVSSSSSSHLLRGGDSSASNLMGMGSMDFISSDNMSVTKFLEHYALMVFYFATHPGAQPGDAKTFTLSTHHDNSEASSRYDPNNDWIHHAATHPCDWIGIHCGHLKRVVFLNLTQQELHGTLPGELKALGHLKRLDLSDNKIQGTIPNLSALTRLEVISLRDNLLEGTVPDLSALTKLETLELGGNPGLIGLIPEL